MEEESENTGEEKGNKNCFDNLSSDDDVQDEKITKEITPKQSEQKRRRNK